MFILDGGIEAWRAAGLELTNEPPTVAPPRAPFEPRSAWERRITGDELLARLDDHGLAIIDTRSPSEYSGDDVLAERGGHITGAELVPWDELLTDDGRLKSLKALRQRLARFLTVPARGHRFSPPTSGSRPRAFNLSAGGADMKVGE